MCTEQDVSSACQPPGLEPSWKETHKKAVDGKAKACGAEVETGDCGWGVPGMPAEISFRTSGGAGAWASGWKAQIYCCQGFQLSLAENAL